MSVAIAHSELNLLRAKKAEREAHLCYMRGAYTDSSRHFEEASELYFAMGRLAPHLECLTYLLRIYAEQEKHEQIDRLETHVLQLLKDQPDDLPESLHSRACYVLGVCASFRDETPYDRARSYFRESINWAVEADDKRALAFALYGMTYISFDSPEVETYCQQLDVIFSVVEVPELQASILILRGLIARRDKNYEQALEYLWTAYRSLRKKPNMTLYIHAIQALGSVYLHRGELGIAEHYIDLAENAIIESELPRLAHIVRSTREKIHAAQPRASYDFRIDIDRWLVFDRWDVKHEIHDQFILRDLILLFFKNPGRVFTKEEITQHVWAEIYHPTQHDNKIYVTIRRLRRLLTNSGKGEQPQVILRAKDGYQLNPELRIQIVS
jgi:tetratricopeptide (TPR) repeat protein